jgi:ribA/ribD-fused uncharacterized protein
MAITKFSGSYRFLSNFYPCSIDYEGLTYPSVEAAYQAAKTTDPVLRLMFTEMKPGDAKRSGRELPLRPDWETIKLSVMTELIQQKFSRHPNLAELLVMTSDQELIEGNTWGDTFWGVCKGVGENHLGKILISVRKDLKEMPELYKC